MKQMGIVTAIEGNTAKISMERQSSCGNCSACKMGQEDFKMEINAINDVKAKVGQWVLIDMKDQDILKAAFMAYVIPLFALLVGIFIGNFLLAKFGIEEFKDIYSALFGFTTMAIAFLGLKLREKKIKNSEKYISVISEIVDGEKPCP